MAAKIAIHSRGMPRVHAVLVRGATTLVGLIALVACGGDNTGPAPVPAAQLYWALHLNWNAVALALTAPYDTVQLTATPVTVSGAPLTSAGVVTYHAVDSTLTVSPTGLVTARYTTGTTQVVASLTVDGMTLVDTAFFEVTPTRPFALASLSIQPQPGALDSAKVSYDRYGRINKRNGNLPVYAVDSSGTEQCTVVPGGCPFPVSFTSSNPEVATLDHNGILTAWRLGHTTFRASALVYGVFVQDSLPFAITYPIRRTTIVTLGSDGQPLLSYYGTLGVGGQFWLTNQISQPVEIVWPYQTQQISVLYGGATYQLTDTIPAYSSTSIVQFLFDSAGTYTAHVTVLGPSGGTTNATIQVSSGP